MAVDCRDDHNVCRSKAGEAWKIHVGDSVKCADLNIDYAKQAYVTEIMSGTTVNFFVQKRGLDISIFGMMNEGSGMQTTMLTTEGARHDTNSVISQLNLYFEVIDPRTGRAEMLNLHMDSCSGQNKNNIMLG